MSQYESQNLQLWGFWYMAGQTVSAEICGLDCGDYTVASDGSITVPFGSDTEGLFTLAYLASCNGYVGEAATSVSVTLDRPGFPIGSNTFTIPVVVGKAYTSQGQGLRPTTQADMKSQTGEGLGKLRRSETAHFLLSNTIGLSVGTDFSALEAMVLPGSDGETALPATSMFSGVARIVITDSYSYDSMICWQVNRPWPCTVCSISASLHSTDL